MASKGNENLKTILVAGLLCFVCSILVSSTAVSLRAQQDKNADLDMKKNILMAAGLLEAGGDVEEAFRQVDTLVVDLETGLVSEDIDQKTYNQQAAAKDPARSVKIPSNIDIAGLSRRAKYAKVYVTKDNGMISGVILPIVSKGLWSTMYGFIALDSDTTTVKGFAYYSQGETPGLGGEVDNPNWKSQWVGKQIFGSNGDVQFHLSKTSSANDSHAVDALSGATITSNGVSNSIKYWFGSHGYEKFLSNIKAGVI